MWNSYITGFKAYLQLEKSLAANSIEAYVRDVEKLCQYLSIKNIEHLNQNPKYKPNISF